MNEDIVEYMRRQLKDERIALVEELARGMVPDYPAYKFKTGQIAAVDEMVKKVDDLAHKLLEDERE